MKIAVFSDVHANLPALEAVLAGIDSQKPDAIYCLGDLVNQNVWNNEVVDIIRSRKITVIKGNHDEGIGLGKRYFPFSYTSQEAKKWGEEAIDYTLHNITNENQAYLAALPLRMRLKFSAKDGNSLSILMAHGSPDSIQERLDRFIKKDRFMEILKKAHTDILFSGNTHCPHHLVLESDEDGRHIFRHAINPGSVGRPKDGDWRPSYALLSIDANRDLLTDPEAVRVDFYRISYDLEKAVKAIKNSVLSVYYGGCLITG